MNKSMVHTPGDGRGRRRVFVDGVEVRHVVFADVENGVIRYHDSPPVIDRSGESIVEHEMRGRVEVVPWQE